MQDWQAFFFDFDGVLVDSVEVKTRAFSLLFEQYGEEIMRKVVRHHLGHGGMNRFDKFRHYYKEFLGRPLGEEELTELCRRFAEIVVDEVVAAPEILGAESFLHYLQGRFPCFVVSATPQEEVVEIIRRRGWKSFFQIIKGAPASKKSNLESLLESQGFQPAQCLFLGDAESDYRAAVHCGTQFLGVLPGPEAPLLQVAPEIQWVKDLHAAKSFCFPSEVKSPNISAPS